MTPKQLDQLAIVETVNNWALWRDAGDWDRFRSVWHSDGWMCATWFQGTASDFIDISRKGFENGVSILHFLGGSTVDVHQHRAIAQTKMTISQRGLAHGELVDVVCTGRFYDFFEKREVNGQDSWRVVRRQPIYEKDRMDPVDPSVRMKLNDEVLKSFPEGYRHLAYLQTELGFKVKRDMPGLRGRMVEALYSQGQRWLQGDTPEFS